ncbi:MAG: hypothetical protein ACSLFA_14375 [Mycobacterium sp.]
MESVPSHESVVPGGTESVPVIDPDGMPDTIAELEPLGAVVAGEPLYIVVDESGGHLSHHRTPEGAQSAWDSVPDAVGIHESELHQ